LTNNEKAKCHRLYWLCNLTGRRFPAGVAFYNETKGDYRLCVDTFCENKVIYLKPISVDDDQINFRVESAVRKDGLILRRSEIGVGHASVENEFPIYMDIGPFDRTLVLEATA
jgi:hypothetical protein